MDNPPHVTTQVIGDVPLLIGLMIQMGLPELYDRTIGDHGLHHGLSGGWMMLIWLSFILSQADHAKVHVESWVRPREALLSDLTGQAIRAGDFNDTKLSALLSRASRPPAWEAFERALWDSSVEVYQIEPPSVGGLISRMVDSTTAYGYHTIQDEGLLQRGYSKDHRPDLPQLKLMTVVAHPSGQSMASAVLRGNTADDAQYTPLIARARAMRDHAGVLYVGDSKMAAQATRAAITRANDYYLTVAPQTGEIATALPDWIEAGLKGTQPLKTLHNAAGEVIGQGYEFVRICRENGDAGPEWVWSERVQVVRSEALAQQQTRALEARLARARERVTPLGVATGRGHRRYTDRVELEQAVQALLEEHQVSGLLKVTLHEDIQDIPVTPRPVRRGHPTANPPHPARSTSRFRVATVERIESAIQERSQRLGWRVQLTTAPKTVTLEMCVQHYRANWRGERNYHLLKDEPIGISPLLVHNDDQITGLTHLLVVGTRVFGILEWQVRCGLARDQQAMSGVYPGLPTKVTPTPTAPAMLQAIARMELILTVLVWHGQTSKHLTPLPALLIQILDYLHLPTSLYTHLADQNSANSG